MKIWLLKIIKNVKGYIFFTILLSCFTTISFVGLMGLSAYLIVLAAFHPSIAALQIVIVGVRFFGISRSGFRYLERLLTHSMILKILKNVRVDIFKKISSNFPFNLSGNSSYEMLGLLIQDIESIEIFLVRILLPIVSTLCVTIIISLFLGVFSVELVLMALLGFVMVGIILPIISAKIGSKNNLDLENARFKYQERLLNFLQFFQESLIFYQNETIASQMLTEENILAKSQWKIHVTQSFFTLASNLSISIIALTALWISILLNQKNLLDVIFIAVFYLIFLSMFESLQNLSLASNLAGGIDNTRKRIEQISIDMERRTWKTIESDEELFPIKLYNVSFRYASSEENAINNLNLSIYKKEKIAIVGENGSGKTTVLDLLSGFYDNYSGQIIFGKNELRSIDKNSLRFHLSYVINSPYTFSTSLLKNLLLANPNCKDTEIDFVLSLMNLEKRFDTLNDLTFTEKGRNISSGEKQKIEIARCMLRKSELILLDEPFSNLDPVFVNEAKKYLYQFFEQKTVIWVTHQFVNMHYFDKILVFEKGSIIEEGNHSELLEKKGIYFQLVSGNRKCEEKCDFNLNC